MAVPDPTCPLPRSRVVDQYFMEHRAKLLDVAAFLDRLERAQPDVTEDYRVAALCRAAQLLTDGQPRRVERILDLLSDPTTLPLERSPGKGAAGAYRSEDAAADKMQRK